ncbi:hypothetical protein V5T82_05540 [Magnetovibrio sp. PR-2]|uniref:hypothetical protein n=1 Tax=Magnetovibrio sp. PR-2 TaxID=3120356 RepID=UPI002FCE475C
MRTAIAGIDFYDTLVKVFLSFLLFAGAMHVDLEQLLKRKTAIALMPAWTCAAGSPSHSSCPCPTFHKRT